ncbi:MAG TPA: undecaprenyldiphospho-muramoylpentapeptide beta-N-acetylglucosaminyltransferase [Kiritimatiellia bacterium]|nr:undecaprenyldiphospho-muramoylpentapeptide beta-N-acetylglucosaminyltransferase [Kiritimatiellia bacterium]
MRVAVACGGTGGHIFPGLATAEELRRRGHEVTLWLAGKDVEHEAVRGWTGEVACVPAEGFQSRSPLRVVSTAVRLVKAVWRVRQEMAGSRPDAVLAMGSYASVGPVGAALTLGVPVVLHEANVIPGRAIAMLSRWSTAVCGCFEETRYYLRGRDLMVTGMPLRKDLVEDAAGGGSESTDFPFTFLVMGGSRGAHKVNDLVSAAFVELSGRATFRVLHLTGEKDAEWIRERYRTAGVDHEVMAFTRDMAPLYHRADYAICRSGASTCSELCVFGLPSLLVPYPFAVRDHQMANARAMEKLGAADVAPERDLNVDWLVTYLDRSLRVADRRERMAKAARSRAIGDGAERLADVVEKVMGTVE